MSGQLAVLTTLYHSSRSLAKYRIANYWRARLNWEAAGATVFTVESAVDGMAFTTPEKNSWHLRRRPGVHPWIKEHLVNYGLKRMPSRYTKIAWIDADVLFEGLDWPDRTCELLEQTPLIQMFDQAGWGVEDGSVAFRMASCVANAHRHGSIYTPPYYFYNHPGFGWAATRDFFQTTDGLFYRAGSMSGDAIMAAAFGLMAPPAWFISTSLAYKTWSESARAAVPGVPGYLAGQFCTHLWHGPVHERRYWEFDSALAKVNFSPDLDLIVEDEQLVCRRRSVNHVFERFGCT